MLLLGLFIALFTLGYVMYSTPKKCTYKHDNWLYDLIYNHDSEISILGICIMVIFGTAIMIWLLLHM